MNKEEISYHVEVFWHKQWRSCYTLDTLELARSKKDAEKPYFDDVRIIKETRIVKLEEIN